MKPYRIVALAALAMICWAASSCTMSVGPDGSKAVMVDPATATAIAGIIAAK